MKVGLGVSLGTIVQVHFAFSDALVALPCTCSATKSLKMFCEKYAVNFDEHTDRFLSCRFRWWKDTIINNTEYYVNNSTKNNNNFVSVIWNVKRARHVDPSLSCSDRPPVKDMKMKTNVITHNYFIFSVTGVDFIVLSS